MGQEEVYSLLKRHRNKWFSSKEVAERLKLSIGSVTNSLKKLRKGNVIHFKLRKEMTNPVDRRKGYVYRFKK